MNPFRGGWIIFSTEDTFNTHCTLEEMTLLTHRFNCTVEIAGFKGGTIYLVANNLPGITFGNRCWLSQFNKFWGLHVFTCKKGP